MWAAGAPSDPGKVAGHSPFTANVIRDLIGIADALVVVLTGVATGLAYSNLVAPLSGGLARLIAFSLFCAIVFLGLGRRDGAYDLNRLRRLTHEGAALLARWSIALLVLVAFSFLLKVSEATSRGWLFAWYGVGALSLLGVRLAWRQLARRLFEKSSAIRRRVAIVGSNEIAQRVCARLRRMDAGVEIQGVYDDNPSSSWPKEIGPAGIVHPIDDLIARSRTENISDVILALPWTDETEINRLVRRLRVLPCAVHLCPGVPGELFSKAKASVLGDVHAFEITRRSMEGWAVIWKIVQDRILAGLGLILVSPLLAVIAVLIRLESRGPALFRQRRHGFNQRIFHIYKFRTMSVCEDGDTIVQAKSIDPRITRVGAFLRRWSLDELPQLFNVLRGDMSLVGPRPHALAHDDEYGQIIEDYSVRQRTLPGMTGWAQVNGCRGETETPDKMRERVRHDLFYVENWSPLFDLKILARTLKTVLFDFGRRARKPSCVIVVENLPVPFDRRTWQQACALRNAGWEVSVICPARQDYPKLRETIDGISIYRHYLPLEANGKLAFLAEYPAALFHEFRLLLRIWWTSGISVIQACNPPDLIFLVAAPFKLFGTKFVFDHHDVCPELFSAKFGRHGFLHRALLLCEWLTFKIADEVISSNETFREIAIARGGRAADRTTSVYSVPDPKKLYRAKPCPELRNGKSIVIGYVGVINGQDGVDHLINATDVLLKHGHQDIQTVIVGDGPAAKGLRELATNLRIQDRVTFTGYLQGDRLMQALSSFDIAVIPDPVNEYNHKISMNKVFEYSALGIPTVAYPLMETERLLGRAAIYADGEDPKALAAAIERLCRDPQLRAELSQNSQRRAAELFDWNRESTKYVAAVTRALDGRKQQGVKPTVVRPRAADV